MVIRKEGTKYVLYSKKTHRHLGTFTSRKAAVRREQQIEFFKHKKVKLSSRRILKKSR